MSSLKYSERSLLEKILGMRTGYVSDFSDRTLKEFVLEQVGIDIFTQPYEEKGTSKANRIRAFWDKESDEDTAYLIEALLEHALREKTDYDRELPARQEHLFIEARKIITRLKDEEGPADSQVVPVETSVATASALKEESAVSSGTIKSIAELTDEELEAIIRQAENTSVPGSQYQKAMVEWEIRHKKAMLDATRHDKRPAFISVAEGATVNDLTAEGNTVVGEADFLRVDGKLNGAVLKKNRHIIPTSDTGQWWKKPEFLIPLLVAVVSIPWWPSWLHSLFGI